MGDVSRGCRWIGPWEYGEKRTDRWRLVMSVEFGLVKYVWNPDGTLTAYQRDPETGEWVLTLDGGARAAPLALVDGCERP